MTTPFLQQLLNRIYVYRATHPQVEPTKLYLGLQEQQALAANRDQAILEGYYCDPSPFKSPFPMFAGLRVVYVQAPSFMEIKP